MIYALKAQQRHVAVVRLTGIEIPIGWNQQVEVGESPRNRTDGEAGALPTSGFLPISVARWRDM
jgi:hypothetical protein